MPRQLVPLTVACAALLAALTPSAGAASSTHRAWTIPMQGSKTGNYGLLRGDFRYGAHAKVRRPTASLTPQWSQPGSYVVAVLRKAPTRRAVAFVFVANQATPPPVQSDARLLFKSPVSNPSGRIVGDPMVLSSSFSTSELCRGLPKRALKPSDFAVLASGGAALGTLPADEQIAEGVTYACRHSGGDALRAALAASTG